MTIIIVLLVGFAIEFTVQTAFLTFALWAMIKLQKLNYNFLGLLGAAALSCTLEIILQHFIGFAFAAAIVVPLLIFLMTKVTGMDHFDVVFPTAVGYVFTFGMNLWLLGLLMGDLRVSAKRSSDHAPVVTTNATQSAADLAAAAAKAREEQALQEMSGRLSLKGVTQGKTPMAVISTGPKAYTLKVGESFVIGNAGTNSVVSCKEIEDHKVVLEVNGKPVTLTMPR